MHDWKPSQLTEHSHLKAYNPKSGLKNVERTDTQLDVIFCPLKPELLPSAQRLSTQAGWNQTIADWERLLRFSPSGVKVWIDESEVRASYSIIGYKDRVAWIGMILVDEAYRGRGLGKTAFHLALRDAQEHGFQVAGLDATEMGEPIYRRFGFECTLPVIRWEGTLLGCSIPSPKSKLHFGMQPGLLEFDLQSSGEDRSDLLLDLARTSTICSLEEKGEIIAYAAVRPGRTAFQIGPVAARSPADFTRIFEQVAAEYSGQRVFCDLLRSDVDGLLLAHGLRPARSLKRMTTPRLMNCLCGENIWCGAGFEWG